MSNGQGAWQQSVSGKWVSVTCQPNKVARIFQLLLLSSSSSSSSLLLLLSP